jgi:hypothetical protein
LRLPLRDDVEFNIFSILTVQYRDNLDFLADTAFSAPLSWQPLSAVIIFLRQAYDYLNVGDSARATA